MMGGCGADIIVDFLLTKMCNIETKLECPVYGKGKVIDDLGNPVEGAFVSVTGSYTNLTDVLPAPCGWTDADGRFHIYLVPFGAQQSLAETLWLRVENLGRFLGAVETVASQQLLSGDVVMKLKHIEPVVVKVEDAQTGKPVIGANISSGWSLFISNCKGEAILNNLYQVFEGDLEISKPGYATVSPSFADEPDPFASGEITIKMRRENADQKPIASI